MGVSFEERSIFDDQLKKFEYIFEFWENKINEMKTNHQTFYFDEAGQVGLYLVDNRECLINGSKEV